MGILQKIKGGIYNGIGFMLVVGITGIAYGAYVSISDVAPNDTLTASTFNQVLANIDSLNTTVTGLSSGNVPVGAVMAFNGTSCPTGWTAADGSGDEKNTSGANTTLDLRGTFVRGLNGSANSRDVSRALGNYQEDAFQNITGEIYGTYAALYRYSKSGVFSGSAGSAGSVLTSPSYNTSAAADRLSFDASNSSGARTSTETRPKNVTLLYCVKQ
ncbi:MAG: hypothetical protein PHS49_00630 [Candidatus Gracilibacteria bacterium]|nr:hypothetical protein [Candidatus Gracilibacteria bacterium]